MIARLLVTIAIVLGCGRLGHADVSAADAKASARQVLIALRVLAYDKELGKRHPGDVVTIAVASSSSGKTERAKWMAGFALLPKVKVGGRPVRAIAIDLGDAKATAKLLAQLKPAAVIVTSDVTDLAGVTAASRAADVLTITRSEAAVQKGFSVGLIAGSERDEIVINIEASRAEGARFGAGLLQLARLVEAD